MNNKKSSSKIWTGILAVLLVLVMAGTAALVGVLSDGFKNWDKFKTEEVQTDETADNGGAIIGEGESNGISLISAKIATADYAANGISTMAETAYQLTATITPENADNKAVDWSVSFVNPSSSWANGKTVTDYVTVTPTSDGALTANLECKQAFGEQIKVTVTSRDNFNATATCTVDYAKRVKSASFKFWSPNNEDKTVVFEGDSSSVMVNYAAGSMLESFDAIKATVPYTRLEQTIEYTDYTVDDTYTLSVTAHENVALFEYLFLKLHFVNLYYIQEFHLLDVLCLFFYILHFPFLKYFQILFCNFLYMLYILKVLYLLLPLFFLYYFLQHMYNHILYLCTQVLFLMLVLLLQRH